MGRLEGSGFIRAHCADRVLAVEERKKKCSRLWSQIWACRCVTGAWTLCGTRQLFCVKVLEEGVKQAGVRAAPDPVSPRFGYFLRLQLPFVWDAPVSSSIPLCFSFE